jgi:LmbE family N-acetylglucosaminyl deacetylase
MPTVLAVGAHPDDVEITCAGTLALLRRAGWEVRIASMTAGDLGSATLSRARISAVRRGEGAAAAKLIGAEYTCLGFVDLCVVYSGESKRRVSGFLRQVRPDLLIVPSPVDYMADHEETPRIFREAAFASTIPNWKASFGGRSAPPCAKLPSVLYCDPIDLVDHFGRPVAAELLVDVTDVYPLRERMLAAHASQRDWLREQHGEDEYLHWSRRLAAARGREVGRRAVKYAEGFRRHLGHGFPAEDVLTRVLGAGRVRKARIRRST